MPGAFHWELNNVPMVNAQALFSIEQACVPKGSFHKDDFTIEENSCCIHSVDTAHKRSFGNTRLYSNVCFSKSNISNETGIVPNLSI